MAYQIRSRYLRRRIPRFYMGQEYKELRAMDKLRDLIVGTWFFPSPLEAIENFYLLVYAIHENLVAYNPWNNTVKFFLTKAMVLTYCRILCRYANGPQSHRYF